MSDYVTCSSLMKSSELHIIVVSESVQCSMHIIEVQRVTLKCKRTAVRCNNGSLQNANTQYCSEMRQWDCSY